MSVRLLSSVVLIHTSDGGWAPGIGDPTFMGWFTVFAYFAACWACVRAYRRSRTNGAGPTLSLAWWGLAIAMGVLGVNKQLDLQSLVTVIGRQLAMDQGWYENRHAVQVQFIQAITAVGGMMMLAGAWMFRRYMRELWLAGLGAVFIVVFVVIRASSFHDVDIFLSSELGGARLNWVFELGGIACVGFGARRYWLRRTNQPVRIHVRMH